MLSANHYWRIVAAGLSYVVFGLGALLPGIYLFCLALIPLDPESKQRRARDVIQCLCRFYVDFMQALGLLSYDLEPKTISKYQGHVVISNHSMLIDALFILAYVDNLCCVVKNDLCHNPFTRTPVRLAGYLANEDEQLVELTKQKLEAGENVLIFPEGTRNQTDLQLKFKRGAANIAVASNAPILPITLCSVPRAVQKGQKWHQLPTEKPRIHMAVLATLHIDQCIDTTLTRTLQYRHLTEYLRQYYRQKISASLHKLKA